MPGKRHKDILQDNKESVDSYKDKLDILIKDFGNCDPMELEIIATTHFIYNNMKYLYRISEKSVIIEEIKKRQRILHIPCVKSMFRSRIIPYARAEIISSKYKNKRLQLPY